MNTLTQDIKVGALAPWYGSNRMLAPEVGKELNNCPWVGIVFGGGMCELPHIGARTLQINDLHRHICNLGQVAADARLGPKLYRHLRRIPFHPDRLAEAQAYCRAIEAENIGENAMDPSMFSRPPTAARDPFAWAMNYFVASWMSRHGTAGTAGEFRGGISTRWNANGGDSAAHFWGAVKALVQWRRVLTGANFTTLDFRAFLDKCKDQPDTGIYADPPFPDAGDAYRHSFTHRDHRDLAARLASYGKARVVARFYDHPLVRELYPASRWTWRMLAGGRKQTNEAAPEVLLLNGKSYAEASA